MSSETIRVEGLNELLKSLESLPVKIERRVLSGGLRAGARVVANKAKSLVRVRSGSLRKSIRVSSIKPKNGKRGQLVAAVKAGGKRANVSVNYAGWVERGTKAHEIKAKRGKALKIGAGFRRSVVHPGAKPNPYLAPALRASAGQALDAMAAYIRERLPKEVAKLAGVVS